MGAARVDPESQRELERLADVVTSEMVAQAARHEALGHLDNAQKLLYILDQRLRARPDLAQEIGLASTQIKAARRALDKMKIGRLLRHGQTPSDVSVSELVSGAVAVVSDLFDAHGIEARVLGPSAMVRVAREAVTTALLHLATNSVDAFQRRGARLRNRRIDIRWTSEAGMVCIQFSDNARVARGQLVGDEDLACVPWQEAIFHRGVTSKVGGTGYGLFLARRLIEGSGGESPSSIELVSYDNGAVFAIRLPAADALQA